MLKWDEKPRTNKQKPKYTASQMQKMAKGMGEYMYINRTFLGTCNFNVRKTIPQLTCIWNKIPFKNDHRNPKSENMNRFFRMETLKSARELNRWIKLWDNSVHSIYYKWVISSNRDKSFLNVELFKIFRDLHRFADDLSLHTPQRNSRAIICSYNSTCELTMYSQILSSRE